MDKRNMFTQIKILCNESNYCIIPIFFIYLYHHICIYFTHTNNTKLWWVPTKENNRTEHITHTKSQTQRNKKWRWHILFHWPFQPFCQTVRVPWEHPWGLWTPPGGSWGSCERGTSRWPSTPAVYNTITCQGMEQ